MNVFAPGYRKNGIESPEAKAEIAKGFYTQLLAAIEQGGGELTSDMGSVYDSAGSEELIVRREDPVKVLEQIAEGDDITIGHDDSLGDYANALSWKSEYGNNGLRHAFLEGHGHYLGVVTVVGFRKGTDLRVSEVENLLMETSGPDRNFIRSVSGNVHVEDLAFLAIRIPAQRFDEKRMTEDELERYEEWQEEEKDTRTPLFIYRGTSFEKMEVMEKAA